MSFFSKFFGSKDYDRGSLDHASDLQLKDIVKFGFLSQQDLSNKRFEVAQINTYDFQGDCSVSFTLKGEDGSIVYLSVIDEDGKEYLEVSKEISRKKVQTLFNNEEFAKIFDEGAGTNLSVVEVPNSFKNWVADKYTETADCLKGYYHEGDYRNKDLPKYEDESESLDFYLLEDDNDQYAIEIEVYEGGETEVSTVVYLELSAIDEMWPSA